MTSPRAGEEDKPSGGCSPAALVGINALFVTPYLYLLPASLHGGRGAGVLGVFLVPVLLLHAMVTLRPAIRSLRRFGWVGVSKQVWISTIVSLVVGAAVAVLLIVHETGC